MVKHTYWVGQTFEDGDRIPLLAAAYLYYIEYTPSLHMTGFHPLDGALYVRSFGYGRLASHDLRRSQTQFISLLRSSHVGPHPTRAKYAYQASNK